MDELLLNISDIRISIHSEVLPIHQEEDLAYLAFAESEKLRGVAPDMQVELEVGEPQSVLSWSKAFEDDQSWSIYKRGEEYAMHFEPDKHGVEPLWVAYFSEMCDQIIVKCSKRLICQRNGERGLLNPVRYPLDQHLIMYHLANKRGILIHAAGLMYSGKGWIFPGRSGAGKSTLTRLLSGRKGWYGLSDDRMLIREMDSDVFCFGTPWPGNEGVAVNEAASLSGVFFLSHGKENAIHKLSPQEAIQKLIPVVSIPWYDEKMVANLLQLCADILSNIPAFELCFRPSEDVGEFLEEYLISKLS